MLKAQFGIAKLNKYASRESGDTFELVERPVGLGGLTGVLVDGQGSGRSAKSLSNFVAGHCVELIKQGVWDSVVARAANDLLYNHKNGQVSATLNLLSVDLATRSLVISRNNPQPVYLAGYVPEPDENAGDIIAEQPPLEGFSLEESGDASDQDGPQFLTLNETAVPLGIYPRAKPVVREFPLQAGLVAVAFTDGISDAGNRYNPDDKPDLGQVIRLRTAQAGSDAQRLADELLELALLADKRRPQDDMCVAVLVISEIDAEDGAPVPRRMTVEMAF